MRDIAVKLLELRGKGTGRYRYRMIVEGVQFFSVPMNSKQFLEKWEDMNWHAELSCVEYESNTEYTSGNYIWYVF